MIFLHEKIPNDSAKSRERYQLLIQNSIDTIAVIHNDKWVFMNESGISLFEAETYEDLIGKNVYDQLHPCDHDGLKQRIQNIIDRKTESEIIKQSWFTFKNRLIYTEMVCIPTTFSEKRPCRSFCVIFLSGSRRRN
ncbi:PAS domain-containing protein [Bacillus velezensis]|nr:PAS domain-containing protein [Bacillus velezensis]